MKIFVIIVVLLMALAGLYYRGEKSVHIEKDIAASPKEVWKVLINTEAYADWNTVIKPLSGTVMEGQKLNPNYSPLN
ncbi:hypothetical protein [Persicobacter diffluens]|uniref:SRPBCC domain-containing protein n=1 Tax=Persicobacter diffluens TaxID=981 RepID=A0AAN4W1P3_9BACT|nr:hypothetical protein PEDI_36430 [Persicobacter diffluens]